MAYGLGTTGFVIKKYSAIRADLIASLRATLGNISTGTATVFGIIITIISNTLADLWESAQASYYAYFPRTASGVSLDYGVERIGISRKSATHSTVYVDVTGEPGTTVPAGFQVLSSATKTLFALGTSTDLSFPSTACIVKVDSAVSGAHYSITIGGTGPEMVAGSIDTTATIAQDLAFRALEVGWDAEWDGADSLTIRLDDGTAFSAAISSHLSVSAVTNLLFFAAVKTGALAAPAQTITTTSTPVSGVYSVSNPADASPGLDTETDDVLRARYFNSMRLPGKCTIDGMRANLLQNVPHVSQCYVFENLGLVVDPVIGNPPGSIAVIIVGSPDPAVLGSTIFGCKPAGVPTWGTHSVTVIDNAGDPHVVYYSPQTVRYIWLDVTVSRYAEENLPSNYKDQIYAACASVVAGMTLGKDVILARFVSPVVNISGVRQCTVTAALRTDTNVPAPGEYSAGDPGTPGEIAVGASELVSLIDPATPSVYINVTLV